ncbi:uncharacterized protein F4807DRAFT_398201 [Annulohypoxylon truncatum]|uniref:uncharacterized protein n=1 Tax=Annulohypoxylon truncatum TaxID=327061 RepID=UPI002008A5D3|nr:uncharacterized protein F4807DRAFT_398201 [Annulohypoxylon truncatum]KAI1211678.1 hypothetical protein F4807DRAFT_398201 [Annulohypoxylon truncatum]
MWPSQLLPFLLALAATTCAGSPLYAAIIPTIPSLTITPTILNISTPLIPIPTFSTSRITRHTPLPLHSTTAKTPSSNSTSASTGVIPHPLSPTNTAGPRVARGDIHSGVTTATLYSDGHAYTVTQYSEVNPELSTIGLTTTMRDGTLVTAPATMPIISATSDTGSPWRTTATSSTWSWWSEDPGMSSRVSVGLPTVTSAF